MKRFSALITTTILALLLASCGVQAPPTGGESTGSSTSGYTTLTDTTETDEATVNTGAPSGMELKSIGELQYYLYSPSNPTSGMPLIVYLHGGTNKAADVTALLTTEGFPKYLYEGHYGDLRAFVVIPKLESKYKGWVEVADQIGNLIEAVHADCAVDKSKVSLTGHSMGGTGTYQLQVKLPDAFACIAPTSGSMKITDENLSALSKTKIWAFVGTEDTIVSPDISITIIQLLNEKGANAKITELAGATHFDVPSLAYKNTDLIGWLVTCGE